MVEHRVDELADQVSRVVMMDHGIIVFDGSPKDAFSRRRSAVFEDAQSVPVSAWFPQAAEFALALGDDCGVALTAANLPLNVREAVAFSSGLVGERAALGAAAR